MRSNLIFDKAYKDWLADIKARVRNAQIKAAVKVNTELLDLYWWLGGDIVEKQKKSKWGDGLLVRLRGEQVTVTRAGTGMVSLAARLVSRAKRVGGLTD